MNRFFKTMIASAVLASLVVPAMGQGAGPKPGGQAGGPGVRQGQRGPGQMMQRMAQVRKEVFAQLKLNEGQKTKIAALQKKQTDETAKLRKANTGGGPPAEGQREKFRTIREDYRKGLQKVLTAAQWEQYQKLMREKMQALRPAGGPGGPGGPGAGRRANAPKKVQP